MRYRQRHNLFTCSLLRLLHFFLLHFFPFERSPTLLCCRENLPDSLRTCTRVLQHFCVVSRWTRAFYDTFVLVRELTGCWTERGPRHGRVLALLSNDTFVLLNVLPSVFLEGRMFWAMFSYRSPIHGRGTQTFGCLLTRVGKKVSWTFLQGMGTCTWFFLLFLHFFDFVVFLVLSLSILLVFFSPLSSFVS